MTIKKSTICIKLKIIIDRLNFYLGYSIIL
jgi:hypothetical protein